MLRGYDAVVSLMLRRYEAFFYCFVGTTLLFLCFVGTMLSLVIEDRLGSVFAHSWNLVAGAVVALVVLIVYDLGWCAHSWGSCCLHSCCIGALQLLWLPLTPAVFAWKDGILLVTMMIDMIVAGASVALGWFFCYAELCVCTLLEFVRFLPSIRNVVSMLLSSSFVDTEGLFVVYLGRR